MPQSIFYPTRVQHIDATAPDAEAPWLLDTGVAYLGGSKSLLRRGLVGFDMFGAAASGRALQDGDSVTAAELLLEITGVFGASGWAARVERIARAEWDHETGTWNEYRAGDAWTSGGGDVATPPDAVGFASPVAVGAFEISGVTAFVEDAGAHRGGLALLRLKADDEGPGSTAVFSVRANETHELRPRLRVTYTAAEAREVGAPRAPVLCGARPHRAAGAVRVARPSQPGAAAEGG